MRSISAAPRSATSTRSCEKVPTDRGRDYHRVRIDIEHEPEAGTTMRSTSS